MLIIIYCTCATLHRISDELFASSSLHPRKQPSRPNSVPGPAVRSRTSVADTQAFADDIGHRYRLWLLSTARINNRASQRV